MSETKTAAIAIVAIVVGLVIGLFIPFGQVAPTTITKGETIPTAITETQTQINTVTKTQTISVTRTQTATATTTQTPSSQISPTQYTTTGEYVDFRVVNVTIREDWLKSDIFYATIWIENTGTMTAHWVEAVGSLYDEAGNLLGTERTYASIIDLDPGERDYVLFQVIAPWVDEIASYEFVVSSDEVTATARTWITTTRRTTTTPTRTTTTTTTTQVTYKYVGSVNSNVYHYPWCSYAKRIKPENLIWFVDEHDAKSQGYRPCKVCKPPG